MSFDFDQVVTRRGTGSAKWELYPEDVLPMWVADMDFASPEPVVRALHERAAHGFFGYTFHSPRLPEVVCERMERLYGWQITPEQIVFLPSLVSGINVVCRAIGEPGDSVLTLTPAYPPFLSAPGLQQRVCDKAELACAGQGPTIGYSVDWGALEGAFHERTRLFLLSSPHNPVGVAYDPATLRRMAELCLRHDAVICSDEIHCDLLLGETRHTPMAALAPEIAERTITLMSPSKTFNVPGLGCGLAIVSNPELRKALERAMAGIVPHVNAMGLVAAQAAFEEGDAWLTELRAYLTANRDFYVRYVAEHLPGLRTTVPAATYLGWLDCREAGIEGSPYKFFLERAKVALSDGATFGPGGAGFVRLNFGCPRALLREGLERMRAALEQATR
ncbi:MAG: putative C-S lyase [Chloroflexales bacterium]|nr:putative C-S lyase [Chloroflexales bacterium]